MTSQNSISADKNNNFKFLLGTLKGAWTQGVVSFSVIFFIGPILLLLACNSYDETIYRPKSIEGLVSSIYGVYSFYNVVAAMLAVFFAIAMFNYLNSRVSVNFYHSLPFKRTRMFFTNYFSGIAMFSLGLVLNYLICIAIPAVTDMGFAECLPAISSVFINAFIYFIFIYSMTVMIGMTTGLAPVQWLMTVAAVAILPAIKVCVNLLKSFYYNEFWLDYFMEYDKFLPTSPVAVLFENRAFTLKTKTLFLMLAVLFTVIAVILYHYRLSEKSGNPFVFGKFASVIKYLIMFPASMAFAIIFGALGDENFIWLIFGSVSGAVVAWMIMNSIINKTARAMFTAVRGMIIFTAVATAFNIFLTCAVEPIENFLLNDAFVKSVTLELDGYNELSRVTFKEDESKNALVEMMSMEIEDTGVDYETYIIPQSSLVETNEITYDSVEPDGYITIDGTDYYVGSYDTDRIRVRAVARTWFGYEIAREIVINDRVYDYFDKLEAIVDSDEYNRVMTDKIDSLLEGKRIMIDIKPNMIKDGKILLTTDDSKLKGFNNYNNNVYDENAHGELFEAYKKDLENVSFESYNSPVLGEILIEHDDNFNYSNFRLPITLKFANTLEYLEECGLINSVDFAGDLAEVIEKVHIYDYMTGEVMTVKDTELKKEVFESIDTYGIYCQYSSYFNTVDHRYKVFYDFSYTEEQRYSEYKNEPYSTESTVVELVETYEGNGTARAEFVCGNVPTFVEEYFES